MGYLRAGWPGCRHYLAQDWRTYHQVILKVPDDTVVGDRPVFEYLQREIEMRASLNHPSLQRTLNQGEKRQEMYLVLEYLPEVTLRTLLLKTGTADLATEEIVRIVIAVCDALAYLHTSGVIHRDLKPEHILLLSTGEVKLTGLGIAEWLKTRRRNWPVLMARVWPVLNSGRPLNRKAGRSVKSRDFILQSHRKGRDK